MEAKVTKGPLFKKQSGQKHAVRYIWYNYTRWYI